MPDTCTLEGMSKRELVLRVLEENGHLSKLWLAKEANMEPSTVFRYLSGERKPRDPRVWDVLIEILIKHVPGMKADLASAAPPQLLPLSPSFPMVKIPIVATASAGRGDSEPLDETLEVPIIFSNPNYRGLVAKGDSQADEILGDDTVIVDRTSERKPGVISCLLCGPELLLKKLEWSRVDSRWEMHSRNSAYPPVPLPYDAVVQGFVVGVYRPDASGVGFEMKFDPTGRRFGAW